MIITNKLKLAIINRNHIRNRNIKYLELLFSRIIITNDKQIIIRNRKAKVNRNRNRNRKAKGIRFSN